MPWEALGEEALAFGWIDSRPAALDEQRSTRLFSKRKRKRGSGWSAVNKRRIAKLQAEGRMQPAGLAAIAAAKRDGSWTKLDDVDAHVVPPDLGRALRADRTAKRYFDAFPPSSKKIILEWIAAAKRPETRAKRIAETVRLARDDIRANHYRQPAHRER